MFLKFHSQPQELIQRYAHLLEGQCDHKEEGEDECDVERRRVKHGRALMVGHGGAAPGSGACSEKLCIEYSSCNS